MNTKEKKPWPTKAVMEQVYKLNLWGNNKDTYYSGVGSHHPEIVIPYLKAIIKFLSSFNKPISVCDLGCGDFNIGKALVKHTKHYSAVDIVKELIEHNKEKFKKENLEFYCMDIAVDNLPSGDCAILRQVLQHLSNSEVQSITEKLQHYKYVIITEHIPEEAFTPNKDIISGQGTRLKKQSGINLLEPPFNFKVKDTKQLLSVSLPEFKGVIETTLYAVI